MKSKQEQSPASRIAQLERELEIEAALEQVRARTMAMQQSHELAETVSVLFKQLIGLGLRTEQIRTCGIVTFNANEPVGEQWITETDGEIIPQSFMVPYNEAPAYKAIYESWKNGDDFKVIHLDGESLKEHLGYLAKYTNVPIRDVVTPQQAKEIYNHVLYFSNGCLFIITKEALPRYHDVFKRFGAVFQQSYTRFLDLQKAEAQAREAQIEAALERVRSKTMAMHNSEDVGDTVATMFDEVVKLGVEKTIRCGILIIDNSKHMEVWTASSNPNEEVALNIGRIDMMVHPMLQNIYDAWKKKRPDFSYEMIGDDLKNYYQAINDSPDYPVHFEIASLPSKQTLNVFFFPEGGIFVFSPGALIPETAQVFKRSAGVFGQTYRRYLDLQKAEAQARQAQIEVAMEKVRSRSLAMQKPEELVEVAQVLRQEMASLGVEELETSSIYIHHEATGKTECWYAIKDGHAENKLVADHMDMDLNETWVGRQMFEFYRSDKNRVSIPMQGAHRKEWINYCSAKSTLLDGFYGDNIPDRTYHLSKFSDGYMGAASPGDISAESWELLQRATAVFSFAYTRFSDLQQAEAQARESQIEAALERVRSRTMGMQKSDELKDVIQAIYEQFVQLGLDISSAGFVMDYKKTPDLNLWIAAEGQPYSTQIHIPYLDHPIFNLFIQAKEKSLDFYPVQLTKEEKDTLFRHHFKYLPGVADEAREQVYSLPGYADSHVLMKDVVLYIQNFTGIPYSDADNAILMRFGKVFEQTYTRFNDLQKAEAQAREAQIEASLERVRSAAMSMQKSEDLAHAVAIVFEELDKLNLGMLRCGIGILDKEKCSANVWTTTKSENETVVQVSGDEPMNIHPLLQRAFDAWVKQEEDGSYILEGEDLKNFYKALTRTNFKLPDSQSIVSETAGYKQFYYVATFHSGNLYAFRETEFTAEAKTIMKRFADVFDFTYTRFNDLKQAEAQAREAKIETALERVRAVAMSMMKSDELLGVCESVFTQLNQLGFTAIRDAQIYIRYDEKGKFMNYSFSDYHGTELVEVFYDSHPRTKRLYDTIKDADEAFVAHNIVGEELENWKTYLKNSVKQKLDKKLQKATELHYYLYSIGSGAFGITMFRSITDEELAILKRFRNVFNLSYQRYADISRAETQAKEAKIEAALERVRSRTMAMQKSEELAETSVEVFKQLISQGIQPNRLFIGIIKDDSCDIEFWATDEDGSKIGTKFIGNSNRNQSLKKMFNGWKTHKKWLIIDMHGKELQDYFQYLADELKVPFKQGRLQKRRVQSIAFFSQGFIGIASPDTQPEETTALLERFAGVFNLTYTRFNDLKLAEEQAREAKIEAALEKVRGKALAMYSSKDLSVTASMVFTELRKLGINPLRCGVGMMSKQSRKVALYSATASAENDSLALVGWVMLSGHPVLDNIYDSLLNGEDYFPVLKGKQLKAYYEKLLSGLSLPSVPDAHSNEEQYGHFFPFQDGCLYAWSDKHYTDPEIKILKRFASVIDLTFRRYIELQKSEASALEAVRQASVDRVRAEIASMRTTNDLEKITPLVWNELTHLGVPFIRCGVFIVDEGLEQIHSYLSTPDGKAIAAFPLTFDADGIGQTVLSNWRNKQPVVVHWNEEEFQRLSHSLVEQGAVESEEKYLTEHPPTSLDLHFFPFLQGMLYVGNIELLGIDQKDLVQSLADAFSTAYARYEDFNKLEAAKEQVENTLTELKAAQTKLIQSEKMASLGELTAGIAHEIQNPLNFVNNFSEVNQEMIDELEDELKSGNIDEALVLAAHIKQNEQKINHHGKRADGIVKGMLQHSRSNSGEKQPTDMNTLADEFMRLAYHGLRAKDKTFNAEMVTHFDPELPKISVLPQDMGRVMLNLFNNAFYAVNQKVKTVGNVYKPEVSVATSAQNGQVVISVKDNGIGIPDAIKDKIMQPFFTTKPTGEGTGLGLSLTYDMVVKGHGGSIQINSIDGEGSEFIISLPV